MSSVSHLLATAFVSSGPEDDDDYWLTGDTVLLEVCRDGLNDPDFPIRIGVLLDLGMPEVTGIYLSSSGARDLLVALIDAILEEEER